MLSVRLVHACALGQAINVFCTSRHTWAAQHSTRFGRHLYHIQPSMISQLSSGIIYFAHIMPGVLIHIYSPCCMRCGEFGTLPRAHHSATNQAQDAQKESEVMPYMPLVSYTCICCCLNVSLLLTIANTDACAQDPSSTARRRQQQSSRSDSGAWALQLSKSGRSSRSELPVPCATAEVADGVASQTQNDTTVSMLGIGLMGNKMARRLSEKGFQVTAWNRDSSKTDALSEVPPYTPGIYTLASLWLCLASSRSLIMPQDTKTPA